MQDDMVTWIKMCQLFLSIIGRVIICNLPRGIQIRHDSSRRELAFCTLPPAEMRKFRQIWLAILSLS